MAIVTAYPTANAAETGAGLTNPANCQTSSGSDPNDGVYATAAPGKNTTLATKFQNFGLDSLIPAGSTITNVTISYEWKASTTGSVATARTYTKVGGSAGSNHDDTTEPAADTVNTYDVTSERSWTRADLLNGTFEIVLAAVQGASSTAVTFSFDYVKVSVSFTLPPYYQSENFMFADCVSAGVISVTEKAR